MKGILLTNMPNQCYQCPCFYCDDISAKCQALDREVKGNAKPNDCPLKPIPQKLAENFGNNTPTNTYIMNGTERQYLDMFAVGYNKCIDEIIGEEE